MAARMCGKCNSIEPGGRALVGLVSHHHADHGDDEHGQKPEVALELLEESENEKCELSAKAIKELERVKWFLWHGNEAGESCGGVFTPTSRPTPI
jgi:hypothetical protein